MRKIVRCTMCKVEIPGAYYGKDWGYKLGHNMFFCSYSCMKQKESLMNAQRKATWEKKQQ